MSDFEQFLQQAKQRVNQALNQALSKQQAAFISSDNQHLALERLTKACLYSVENGGKRLRPALFYACCNAYPNTISEQDQNFISAAIECVHSYSLVHDDLPAMDDDCLRRGKPTCHIAFDEATAILVGDGLQALAFELLSQCQSIPSSQIVQLVKLLAQAAGNMGMVGGQMMDLHNDASRPDLQTLEDTHRLKTGAMIRICAQMASTACQHPDAQAKALDQYAENIGLAFQVHDDILDIEADTQTLGKTAGSDVQQNKQTYPALLGLEKAKQLRQSLLTDALQALTNAGIDSPTLKQLAQFVVQRGH